MSAHLSYLLRLGDSSLVLGQRLAEWCGHGPQLEEDIAMANIGLDLIGQARMLLQHAAALEGAGRDEDRLAFFRSDREFRNFTLCELPNSGLEKGHMQSGDYAFTIIRNLLYTAYQCQLWEALQSSTDTQLAAIAAKSLKESRYHLRHAADWTVRFGDGTALSHQKAQRALDALMPYTNELFAPDAVEDALCAQGIGVASFSLYASWTSAIEAILQEATLKMPANQGPSTGFISEGKHGLHSEHLGFVLAEMQSLARQHPGATW